MTNLETELTRLEACLNYPWTNGNAFTPAIPEGQDTVAVWFETADGRLHAGTYNRIWERFENDSGTGFVFTDVRRWRFRYVEPTPELPKGVF